MFGLFNKNTAKDRDENLPLFSGMFIAIQEAITNDDMGSLENLCTDELYDYLRSVHNDNRRNNVTNIIENIDIRDIYTTDSWYDEDLRQHFHKVHITCSMCDYYVDKSTNELVEGSKDSIVVDSTFTFTCMDGSNKWYISKLEDE